MFANTLVFRKLDPSRQMIEIHLSPHCQESISLKTVKVARHLRATIETDPQKIAETGAAILFELLPAEARAALQQLSEPSATSLVLLKGVTNLAAPDTPTSGFIDAKALGPHDLALAGAMKLAGTEPIAFPFENSGKIGRNVVSNPAQRGKASSHGFDVDLFWHQDNCGQPFEGEELLGCDMPPMPEQLAFIGVRNNERVPDTNPPSR